VRFTLDQLSLIQQGKLDTPLKGRLDLTRIGVFGHSTGGMTAAEACMRDPRIKACANFDGVVNAQPAYADAQGRGPLQPFLFLEKPLPALAGEKPEEAKQRLGFLRERGNALLAGVQRGRSYRITIEGATHITFSDEETISDPQASRPRELLDLIRRSVREFFNEAFSEKESSFLKNTPSDRAVRIETFLPR
jgi:dienelactone hydrolase